MAPEKIIIVAYCFSFRSLSAELLKCVSADKKGEAKRITQVLSARICFICNWQLFEFDGR